jgi:hypothetical protein
MKTISIILILISVFNRNLSQSDTRKDFIDKLYVQYDEEKFARDYYDSMYEQWKLLAFQNLAKCENAHMKLVKTLIDDYVESNSIKILEPGFFTEDELNKTYKEMIASGKTSENKALIVAGNFEEKYIGNLEALISLPEGQNNKECLGNLLESSVNHLNLIVCHLRHRGIDYKPTLLTVTKYIKCVGDQYTDLDKASADCTFDENGKLKCPFDKKQ